MSNIKTIICITVLLFASVSNTFSQLQITAVLCENKIDPTGVDLQNIRFGWELFATKNEQFQTAYQLVIASSKEKLITGNYDIYNSEKIKEKQSVLVMYKGRLLNAGLNYYWKVRVWDNADLASVWSANQQFTTGLFTQKDWHNAAWIGYEQLSDSMRVAPAIHEPFAEQLGNKAIQRPVIPLFRKTFIISKKVSSALLFITGLGQYELSMNGTKTGTAFLSPGWTYFDKTVLYNTYDVTQQLVNGTNAIGVIVGNGFYNINRERYFKIVSAFGMPTMLCRLKILYDDGTTEDIVSDTSWKTSPAATTFSSIYGGEDYDARLEQSNWNTAAFDDTKWLHSLPVKAPLGKLVAEQDYPVKLMDSFAVKTITHTATNLYLYDFGQNVSGIIKLFVRGKKGQVVKLIPAELVSKNSLVNQAASGDPYYFTYILKSDSEEVWQPKFTYYGFRYVQVEGAMPDTAINSLSLPVIVRLQSLHNRNSNPINGSFECSNQLFNRIYTLINWAIKSNMQSVVTDCPHREKLSWLEQDYLMGASIHYNQNVYQLYRKLVYDLMDAQYPTGFVPDIAPELVVFDGGFLDSPEWGSSAVILPWLLYEWYGDKTIVTQAYPMMQKYVAYLETRSADHILSYGLGDWYDYGPKEPGEAQLTPKALTASAIYYYDVALLTKMAIAVGKNEDAEKYRKLALDIKRSFNKRFFNDGTKVYSTGSQTAMAMPLSVGLVEDKNKKAVLNNLIDSIYASNKALTAGDIGFHFLIKALDEGGASQLIFDMNNRDDVAGYGFQLKKGATALTESWPGSEDVSNNHLMLGHIMEWFYNGLAGIGQEEGSVGFEKIRIRPQPVGDITSAKASFHSPHGWITSEWKKGADNNFTLHIRIPVNSTAVVYLPATATSKIYKNDMLQEDKHMQHTKNTVELRVASGEYWFQVK